MENTKNYKKKLLKVFIKTFGCQMNKYDSERILYLIEYEGYIRTSKVEESDIIIFNTCSVREKPENKLYGHIGRLKKLKKLNPQLLICIGGCTAQNLKEKILKDFPYVDIIFGTHNVSELPELIKKRKSVNNGICSIRNDGFDYDLEKAKRTSKFKSYVPIIIGCNNFCSYCIVPFVRGKEISIPSKSIIKNIKNLVSDGVVEVTLLGQNVNSYGKDLDKDILFSELLEKISYIKGLKRLRFLTSHPKDFSKDIVHVIKERDNVANHIHLPLQSGSDKILKLMNRKYTSDEFLNIVNFIREEIPECFITTDIIIGFPCEERQDFLKTLNLVKKVRFNKAFTFIYSPRKGTKAYRMVDNIPIEEKKEFFKELVEVQNKISYEENKRMIGNKFKVLVEGKSKKNNGMLEGRLENNTIVNFKGSKKIIGSFKFVEIIEARSFYLIGNLCS